MCALCPSSNPRRASSHHKPIAPRKRAYSEAFAAILTERYHEVLAQSAGEGEQADRTQELQEIRQALVRTRNGSFGICETCDETISYERLLRIPQASNCIDCQRELEVPSRAVLRVIEPFSRSA